MILDLLWILLGLVCLGGGGEVLVRGAVSLALHHRIKPAVVGLTVVAAGTSMPELVVSLVANLDNQPDIAVGNVIGSNIYNIALVLGLSSLIMVLPVERRTLKLEWPFLFVVTLLTMGLMENGLLSRIEGLILVAILIGFLWLTVHLSRADMKNSDELPSTEGQPGLSLTWFLVLAGCVLLPLGAKLMVDGASGIAMRMGVSQRVIGLTIVALGTSLPELASSLVAAFRGRSDVAVGNVIGSNVFNLLAILGVTALVRPVVVNPAFFASDVWWMIGFTALLVPLIYFGRRRVSRIDGAVLFTLCIVYTILLVGSEP